MSPKRDESYSPRNRLCKASDFKRVFARGRRTATDHFVLFTAPSVLPDSRLGIQVKARIGTAARRNYIKRIVRESFRRLKCEISRPVDVIFIAREGMAPLKFGELDLELRAALKKVLS
jgi:ribonuclease P protein component